MNHEKNRTHLKSEMRLHKDNGHRDNISGKQRGGNVDKEMNSHVKWEAISLP